MDPTILACLLENNSENALTVDPFETSDVLESLPFMTKEKPKTKFFSDQISSSYLPTDQELVFANLDSIVNFTQRSGGLIAPQEPKSKVFYSNHSSLSRGFDNYLRYRFSGADGLIVSEKTSFERHRLRYREKSFFSTDHQLSLSFGHGIDIFLSEPTRDQITLCGRHLKHNKGFALFVSSDPNDLLSSSFALIQELFNKVRVLKPMIWTGTSNYFIVATSFSDRRQELTSWLFHTDEMFKYQPDYLFHEQISKAFSLQNRLNLFDSKQFTLVNCGPWWGV